MGIVMFWTNADGSEQYYTGRDGAGFPTSSVDVREAVTWPTPRAAYESTACGRCKECESGRRAACRRPFSKLQNWRVGRRGA